MSIGKAGPELLGFGYTALRSPDTKSPLVIKILTRARQHTGSKMQDRQCMYLCVLTDKK